MIERPCLFQQDQEALAQLWLVYRAATSVKIYPTIWRLRLLLTSRVWEPALDTRIWEIEAGKIGGFAMLWRRQPQSPYLVLDYFIDTTAVTPEFVKTILHWGTQRARIIAEESQISLTLFTSSQYNSIQTDKGLETLGFVLRPPDEREYNVYFARSLDTKLPKPSFPPGYTARLLHRDDNLTSYNSIYDFAAVNPQHLQELLASDEYHHRIVTGPKGRFVAYCEYSFSRAEWQRSGQRLGWIDYIGTQPENQRQGLGHALLIDSLQHLRTQDVETVMLVTVSTNTPALNLYQRTRFVPVNVSEPPRYQIEMHPK